jgi:hypothetical protein
MSDVRPPDPAADVSGRIPLRVVSVPKKGSLTIMFLGNVRGIITHWSGKRSIPCPGIDQCPTKLHSGKSIWKGYVAAEVWRDMPHEDWLPCVFEVTEHLYEMYGHAQLRGECMTVTRQVNDHAKREVTGYTCAVQQRFALRPAFDVVPVVQRMYRVLDIEWDVEPPFELAMRMQPTKAPGPVGKNRTTIAQDGLSAAEVNRMLADAAEITGVRRNGRHHANVDR